MGYAYRGSRSVGVKPRSPGAGAGYSHRGSRSVDVRPTPRTFDNVRHEAHRHLPQLRLDASGVGWSQRGLPGAIMVTTSSVVLLCQVVRPRARAGRGGGGAAGGEEAGHGAEATQEVHVRRGELLEVVRQPGHEGHGGIHVAQDLPRHDTPREWAGQPSLGRTTKCSGAAHGAAPAGRSVACTEACVASVIVMKTSTPYLRPRRLRSRTEMSVLCRRVPVFPRNVMWSSFLPGAGGFTVRCRSTADGDAKARSGRS